jgi:DNA (cytosine-5)-methyltransferase 1
MTNTNTNTNTNINLNLKFIDLFAGIGGFHIALSRNGCKCVFASEIDKYCARVYEDNYNIKPEGDITKIDASKIPDFDILCGGFPCQTFSHSGKQEGFKNKTKGTLFFEICRILEYKKPKYFILENVRNLYGHDRGKTWETIYKELTDLGYLTYKKPIIVSPLHFGIPQNRDRVFIIGIRDDLGETLNKYPVYNKKVTNIENILEDNKNISKEILEKIKLNETQLSILNLWEEFVQYFKFSNIKLPTFPIWTDEWGKKYSIGELPDWKKKCVKNNRDFYQKYGSFLKQWLKKAKKNSNFIGSKAKFEWQSGKFQSNDSIWNLLFQFRPSGIRVSRTNYSPALVAMSQIVYVGSRKRKLTPREVARLQSFPDNFKLDSSINRSYKQFGNAVNVNVVEEILFHTILNN